MKAVLLCGNYSSFKDEKINEYDYYPTKCIKNKPIINLWISKILQNNIQNITIVCHSQHKVFIERHLSEHLSLDHNIDLFSSETTDNETVVNIIRSLQSSDEVCVYTIRQDDLLVVDVFCCAMESLQELISTA